MAVDHQFDPLFPPSSSIRTSNVCSSLLMKERREREKKVQDGPLFLSLCLPACLPVEYSSSSTATEPFFCKSEKKNHLLPGSAAHTHTLLLLLLLPLCFVPSKKNRLRISSFSSFIHKHKKAKEGKKLLLLLLLLLNSERQNGKEIK